MNKIGTMSTLLVLATALTLGAFAQTPKEGKVGKAGKQEAAAARKEGRGMGRMGKMMGDLNLTDAQKTKIKTLSEGMAAKRKALMDDKSLSADAKKEKMKELSKSFRADVGKVLTPEQQKKMEEKRKEMRGKFGKGAGRPGGVEGSGPSPSAPKKP